MQIKNAQITLVVDGEEKSFSEEELASIVKEYFAQKQAATQKEANPIQKLMRPTEGVPFPVNPSGINRNLFQKKREDKRQEETRQLILEAFVQVDEYPKKYGKPFNTLMPKKTWTWKTVEELRKLATEMEDHEADWVEQALEWAQRIVNGEPWEDVCNNPDTANWYRLVKWKNGYYRLVGGSREDNDDCPASYVSNVNCNSSNEVYTTVPLVVLYK